MDEPASAGRRHFLLRGTGKQPGESARLAPSLRVYDSFGLVRSLHESS